MRFYFQFFLLFVFCGAAAQNLACQNLKEYVRANSLYDFGYGLEHYEGRLDSIVCYNDFIDSTITFRQFEKNNPLTFKSGDSVYSITLKIKGDNTESIYVKQNKKVVSQLKLHDSLSYYNSVDTAYEFTFHNKDYVLAYYHPAQITNSSRNLYLGVLIDKLSKAITLLPGLQSSQSLLCITDIDTDDQLDYVCYSPSYTSKVMVYSSIGNKWEEKKDYNCNLSLYDGYVFRIKFDAPTFLTRFYDKAHK
jgi:hypothetical protein